MFEKNRKQKVIIILTPTSDPETEHVSNNTAFMFVRVRVQDASSICLLNDGRMEGKTHKNK